MQQVFLYYLQNFGYIGIFFFLMLGIVGVPLPDEIMMSFLGYLTSIKRLNFFLTYLSALTGSIFGITLSYYIGKKLGLPFLYKHGSKIFITEKRLRKSQDLFRKYGSILLFAAYFIPGVRHITAYLAGISALPFKQFGLYAYAGAVVWCATFIGFGHFLGKKWRLIVDFFQEYGFILFFSLTIFVFLLFFCLSFLRQKKKK